jgi:hypothetical protein
MTYAAELAKIARTPIIYVVMSLDYCAEVFGAAPCTATAAVKCYNTFPTCRDRFNFNKSTKDYAFSSVNTPLPFGAGERPYIKSITYYPTEIKDSLTVNAVVKIEFYDEPDTDVGIDPYLSDRSSVQGSFWKKLLARNSNYLGRIVKVYEGFLGVAVGDYEQKFVGKISNVSVNGGVVTVEVSDILKSLNDISIPPILDIKCAAGVTIDAVQLTLSGDGVDSLDAAPGYVRIGDEIIYYGAINTTTKIISSLTRGYFDTIAATHAENDAVQKVRYFAPASGFDHAKTILLTDCAIPAGYVDDATFDSERDDDAGAVDVDFSAIISAPVNAATLYFEIIELLGCKSWVGEDLKITIKRNLPNMPGRSYATLTDAENIVDKSGSVDLNQDSRISKCSIYWDRYTVGQVDLPNSYKRLTTVIDTAAESINEFGSSVEKAIFCRWLRSGYDTEEIMAAFVKNAASRLVSQSRDPMPIVSIRVERKDGDGVKTGAYVKLSTDEIQDRNGDNLANAPFQVVKREVVGNLINLQCLRLNPKKYMIIAPASYAAKDFETATEAEREYGAISDIHGLMAGGDDGYRIW